MNQALLIGYGNPLRQDDGVGWQVAAEISTQFPAASGVKVVQLHQLLPEVAHWLSETERVAVLVDTAVSTTQPPGTITCQKVMPEPLTPTSFSHHLAPGIVVGMAQELYGRVPPTFLLTIVGEDFGMGEGLSTAVGQKLPHLIHKATHLLTNQTT